MFAHINAGFLNNPEQLRLYREGQLLVIQLGRIVYHNIDIEIGKIGRILFQSSISPFRPFYVNTSVEKFKFPA